MTEQEKKFIDSLWTYYDAHARTLPWREPEPDGTFSLYKIAVSELMLQQTQVDRVVPKFLHFISRFPNARQLAEAPFADVLSCWSGLGYNRRALYLQAWAKKVNLDGLPMTPEELQKSKGFGRNTAAAVFVYTYNMPLVFVETNVRTVFLNHFFAGLSQVTDKDIEEQLAIVLDRKHPRDFYWALMDYGTGLKKQRKSEIIRSKHYQKQKPFQGSLRQLRGLILKQLQIMDSIRISELLDSIPDSRINDCVHTLQQEGFIVINGDRISLAK